MVFLLKNEAASLKRRKKCKINQQALFPIRPIYEVFLPKLFCCFLLFKIPAYSFIQSIDEKTEIARRGKRLLGSVVLNKYWLLKTYDTR